ncbi:hypothetical protein SFRURICE_002441 [Spodoptera frugiperda]|uniref:SFRICE_038482 n=1 Tax=Spodoptera frugiperda TaxID=7108 RepID=A0A2H1X5Q7_SPOFR|nr:uncharacterized protein LOC118264138 [Spodoptera frugiperda]KAF9790076.1 hypothetical protein SFRURICE_002441 [Spodoptera frugiperda]
MYRNTAKLLRNFGRNFRANRSFSNKVEASENEPIKFSTSQASRKSARPLVKRVDIDMPWYQPFSVVGSVAVFLIYFCVLREENDLDLEFDKTLYDRIKGLEKEQLLQSYRFNKEHGKSVDDIERRLKELEEKENKVAV